MSQTTPTTLHGFGNFPAEVRQEIWKLALPGPRVVELVCFTERELAEYISKYGPSINHASALHCVNKESREVYERYYKAIPFFHTLEATYHEFVTLPFDFDVELDTLYVSDDASEAGPFHRWIMSQLYHIQQMKQLRTLAVSISAADVIYDVACLNHFTDLERIQVVTADVNSVRSNIEVKGRITLLDVPPHHWFGGPPKWMETIYNVPKLRLLQEKFEESHEWVFPLGQEDLKIASERGLDWVEYRPLPMWERKEVSRGSFSGSRDRGR